MLETITVDTEFVFPYIEKMYPNVDVEAGLNSVERRMENNPSPSVEMTPQYMKDGLRVCLTCNTVMFNNKFYRPIRGVAMGTCHACDFSGVWVGDLVQKYRGDVFDLLLNSSRDILEFVNHLNSLHPNIRFDVRHGKEGEYLDLWLMLKEKIEWKVYMKCPPVYVGPSSCHDPVVRKGIFKGVGHRIRLNSSKYEYFDKAMKNAVKLFL